MIKKVLLLIFIMMTSIFSVSAFTIISSSDIDFVSNSNLYNGNIFVITGVENGGSDTINFEIFKNQVEQEGFVLDKSGQIISDFEQKGWDYSLNFVGVEYKIEILNNGETSFHFTKTGAEDWCFNEQNGDQVVGRGTTPSLYWNCLKSYPSGYFYKLFNEEYKYDIDYQLMVDGSELDTIRLTQDVRDGGVMIGENNFFQANIQTNGRDTKSSPRIENNMMLLYDQETTNWNQIVENYNYQQFDLETSQNACEGFIGLDCVYDWNTNVNNYLSSHKANNINSNYISLQVNGQGEGISGSVNYDDGTIYLNPIVTLTIDADTIVVERSFGVGDIIDIESPNTMEIGESYPVKIIVENTGEGDMTASLNFDCVDYSFIGIPRTFDLLKGERRTLEGLITFTGNVNNCVLTKTCVVTIGNTNLPVDDDLFIFTPKVCERSECYIEGEEQCFENVIKECRNIGGVLKYENVKVCSTRCQTEMIDDRKFVSCDDNTLPVCGDGVCEPLEIEGQRLYCPADCDQIIPLCGDGICDGREREGEQFECVVGKQKNGDCPPGRVDPIDYTMIIFIIVSASLILGALYFRMRKEGYFK